MSYIGLTKQEIYKKAIDTWGVNSQVDVAIEEMAELTKELLHWKRGRSSNIFEEIADVEIMMEQLKYNFNCESAVEDLKRQKLVVVQQRLAKQEIVD